MRQVTLEAMESLLLRYKGRYTAVVGFKPTGWSHAGGSGRNGQTAAAAAAAAAVPLSGPSRSSLSIKPNRRRSQRGTVVLYQVRLAQASCDPPLQNTLCFAANVSTTHLLAMLLCCLMSGCGRQRCHLLEYLGVRTLLMWMAGSGGGRRAELSQMPV
jgi:hypothetical protein